MRERKTVEDKVRTLKRATHFLTYKQPSVRRQNTQGDMIVDYVSPAMASLLAYFFAANSAFGFGKPFWTPGTTVGGPAFAARLQSLLLLNFLAQVGPEIVCDLICIMAERYWGFGELADEYWNLVTSISGLVKYFPAFSLALLANLAVILATGKTACTTGQCVQGF